MKLISNDQPRHFSLQVDHHFLLAITEKLSPDSAAGGCAQFGVAFVDTSIGTFHLGHFDDDRYRSRLSTLLTRFNPVEIISARRSISAETRQVRKLNSNSIFISFFHSEVFYEKLNSEDITCFSWKSQMMSILTNERIKMDLYLIF